MEEIEARKWREYKDLCAVVVWSVVVSVEVKVWLFSLPVTRT